MSHSEQPEHEKDQVGKPAMSRRGFLKGSAVAVGAVALAGCAQDSAETPPPTTIPPTVAPSKGNGNGSGGGGGQTAEKTTPPPVNLQNAIIETWDEPWIWRPDDWPNQELQLNVIEHQSPATLVGFGSASASLFGYNGAIPGPTIRMKGDQTLKLTLLNHLALNSGSSPVGPAPDIGAYPPLPKGVAAHTYPASVKLLPDWCLGEHTNGVHSIHTTNLHTHGLHVRPGRNPDGTHSDNIYARIMPIPDWVKRENSEDCNRLLDQEYVAQGSYEIRLGDVQGDPSQPHPPGTHWYHPHAHGSTHNEVASGLAGFLVVEGDVDEKINLELTGQKAPDPTQPTGDHGYRERMVFIQRVAPGNVSHDPDALARRLQNQNIPSTNGSPVPGQIVMRPNAIERWRVLNGSVDGKGYLRFMVLEGQWVHEVPPNAPANPRTLQEMLLNQAQLLFVEEDGTRTVPTTEQIEMAKLHLYQLAVDGITLMRQTADKPEYILKDLDFKPPIPNPLKQDFTNLADCYTNADTLHTCYNLPNEVYMAPANRTDLLVQMPKLADGESSKVFTVIGKATAIHTANLQRALQIVEADLAYAARESAASGVPIDDIIKALGIVNGASLPEDTIVAYVIVSEPGGKGVEPLKPYNLPDLAKVLPPVPPYLYPVQEGQLLITDADEAASKDVAPGTHFRSRRITYSGWGAATWPRIVNPQRQLKPFDPDKGRPGEIDPVYLYDTSNDADIGTIMMPSMLKSMAINGHKFDPTDADRPRMGLDTAEEWSVFNNSISLFGPYEQNDEIDFANPDTDALKFAIQTRNYQRNRAVGYAVTRAEADARGWNITTRGIDHPFHIHTNPVWVIRWEVPDQDGNLVNILDEPRWHDVVWLPRNGGRVVFRSTYPDYVGVLVNHCHILLHEDNGMMQAIEIVASPEAANYVPTSAVADTNMSAEEVDALGEAYRSDTLDDAYAQCSHVLDPNRLPDRYQEYPAENGAFFPPKLP